MSVDRLAAVVFPHFYLRKVKPRKLVFCNTIIIIFSVIFASLQLSGITMDVYRLIDQHLHATFPLCTTTLCYLGIFSRFEETIVSGLSSKDKQHCLATQH